MSLKILAVHGGACTRRSVLEDGEMLKACKTSASQSSILEAAKFLESNELFNCGVGSSLTRNGEVECEASYMTSEGSRFGAIASVSNTCHPSEAAFLLANDDWWERRKMARPMILVGKGAEQYVEQKRVETCSMKNLKTPKTIEENAKYQKWLEAMEQNAQCHNQSQSLSSDTVGAISISFANNESKAEAITSSGGIVMKERGRLGHSSVYGSACWAEKRRQQFGERMVTICSTGHGEELIKVDFCRSLGKVLLNASYEDIYVDAVTKFILENFRDDDGVMFGGIALIADREEDNERTTCELLIFHNSPFLPVAVQNSNGKVNKFMSTLKPDQKFIVSSIIVM